MNWKCKLGFHKWQKTIVKRCILEASNIFRCTLEASNIFTSYKTTGEVIFEECPRCSTVRAYLYDGDTRQPINAGYMARDILSQYKYQPDHKNQTDKYLEEYAKL